jgi:hypothetical protein
MCTAAAAFAGERDDLEWYDRLSMGGDLRLRAEHINWEDKFDDDIRDRFRYRFRLGMTAVLSEAVELGFQIRSGNPDNPQSDNQSFDGGFSKKEIALSEAFVDWQPRESFGLRAGKFSPKKLWHVSDLQWDDDVIVEGVMGSLRFGGSDDSEAYVASAYQFILEESSDSDDAYLLGGQLRRNFALNDKNRLTAGFGYDSFTRPDKVVGLTLGGELDTEPEGVVTNLIGPDGMLVSDFRVFSAFAQWKNKTNRRWPLSVSLFYYKNLGAERTVGAITDEGGNVLVAGLRSDENDKGYYARVQLGDYKKPGQVAIRLTKYKSEPDAIFYAWVQSDTRRGSNVDGERVDVRIGMPMNAHVNVTFYNTDWEKGTDTTMRLWQFDYILEF